MTGFDFKKNHYHVNYMTREKFFLRRYTLKYLKKKRLLDIEIKQKILFKMKGIYNNIIYIDV